LSAKDKKLSKGPLGALFFMVLIPLSYVYRLFFFCNQWWRRCRGGKAVYPFKIVSVGNISVGGTGKSVVVPWLVRLLGEERCAVVLRGYGGRNERTGKSILVSDGQYLLSTPAIAGDEAVMHVLNLRCPVVVGANRARSCDLLVSAGFTGVWWVVLDDAYQHHSVKKDKEILLLDGRKPFDNGYCLPAGHLRERDLSRAHVIIVTHADLLSGAGRRCLRVQLQQQAPQAAVFFGVHQPRGLYLANQASVEPGMLAAKRVGVFAGIGNPHNVQQSLEGLGLKDVLLYPLPNHHVYTPATLTAIMGWARASGIDALVTTEKDWVKVAPCLSLIHSNGIQIIVLRVAFALMPASGADVSIAQELLLATIMANRDEF